MSTSNIIYDNRFLRGSFHGYRVDIPDNKESSVCNRRYFWGTGDLLPEVADFLKSHGPYRINRGTLLSISFARESTAAMFKLTFL